MKAPFTALEARLWHQLAISATDQDIQRALSVAPRKIDQALASLKQKTGCKSREALIEAFGALFRLSAVLEPHRKDLDGAMELVKAGFRAGMAASLTGVPRSTLWEQARRNAHLAPSERRSVAAVRHALNLLEKGETLAGVARATKISQRNLRMLLDIHRVQPPKRRRSSRLAKKGFAPALALLESGLSFGEVARRSGIAKSTLWDLYQKRSSAEP